MGILWVRKHLMRDLNDRFRFFDRVLRAPAMVGFERHSVSSVFQKLGSAVPNHGGRGTQYSIGADSLSYFSASPRERPPGSLRAFLVSVFDVCFTEVYGDSRAGCTRNRRGQRIRVRGSFAALRFEFRPPSCRLRGCMLGLRAAFQTG